MCFMSGSIEMENTYVPEHEGGMWQWLFGKRITSIVLRNSGPNDGFVGIAAPSLARILPPDAYLCSINDVRLSGTVDQRPRNVLGFTRCSNQIRCILNRLLILLLDADDRSVLIYGLTILLCSLVVKLQGENLVTAILTGPGIVFIQSLPFHRFSQRIARSVTSPNMRENPKFFLQMVIFFFLAYVVIVLSLLLSDI
ncbi:hypothetical protein GQ457_04G037260 [Hibiscus cannabinus]